MGAIVRRSLAAVFLLLFTAAVLELVSFVAYLVVEGERFSYARFDDRRAEILRQYAAVEGEGEEASGVAGEAVSEGEGEAVSEGAGEIEDPVSERAMVGSESLEVPHPFLGYVRNPFGPRPKTFGPINEYGWRGSEDPFHTADDEATIVIVGGSVAYRSWSIRDILIERIETLPQFRDKRFYYEILAGAGYKQPNQLASVTYYLALGGKIDILINLDGFNEVQYMRGTNYYPVYPRKWIAFMKDVSSLETLDVFGRAHFLKGLRLQACRAASKASLSVTANVFWHFLDRMMRSELDRLSLAAEGITAEYDARGKETKSKLPYWRSGPDFEGGTDERARFSVNVWANSSIALEQLADGFGFYYFHFLQPNQYVPDSKPFTEEERAIAFSPKAGKRVPVWYPQMEELGEALREQGVLFFSLTDVFNDVLEPTYRDSCCHLNRRGKDIMAERMAEIMVESIESSPTAKSFERAPQL